MGRMAGGGGGGGGGVRAGVGGGGGGGRLAGCLCMHSIRFEHRRARGGLW